MVDIDDNDGEPHDDHVATRARFMCESAFSGALDHLLSGAMAALGGGERVDFIALQKMIDDASDGDPEWDAWRGDYLIEVECPPIVARLIDEARSLADSGLNDEAVHRLRLAARPKWPSERVCREAYEASMAERAMARRRAADHERTRSLGLFAELPLGASIPTEVSP